MEFPWISHPLLLLLTYRENIYQREKYLLNVEAFFRAAAAMESSMETEYRVRARVDVSRMRNFYEGLEFLISELLFRFCWRESWDDVIKIALFHVILLICVTRSIFFLLVAVSLAVNPMTIPIFSLDDSGEKFLQFFTSCNISSVRGYQSNEKLCQFNTENVAVYHCQKSFTFCWLRRLFQSAAMACLKWRELKTGGRREI